MPPKITCKLDVFYDNDDRDLYWNPIKLILIVVELMSRTRVWCFKIKTSTKITTTTTTPGLERQNDRRVFTVFHPKLYTKYLMAIPSHVLCTTSEVCLVMRIRSSLSDTLHQTSKSEGYPDPKAGLPSPFHQNQSLILARPRPGKKDQPHWVSPRLRSPQLSWG